VRNDPGSISEDPEDMSSSMANSLDSESDLAYCPSRSPTPSSSLPGSNHSSCKLVDMVPKRSHPQPVIPADQERDTDAIVGTDQASQSRGDLDLQPMRPE
jgi:hypothetical protein